MSDYLEQKLQDASGAYAGEYLYDYEKVRICKNSVFEYDKEFGSPCERNYYTILYISQGSALLRWKDQEFALEKGNCLLGGPRWDDYQIVDAQDCVAYTIDFVPQIFDGLIAEPRTVAQLLQSTLAGLDQLNGLEISDLLVYQDFDGAVAELVERCCQEYRNRPFFYTELLKNYIKSILVILSRSIPGIPPAFSYSDIVQYMLDYIHGNYMFAVTLKELGKQLNYNPAHLSAIFQKEVGYPFKDYLARRRIYASAHVLQCTNETVEQVARRVGYKKADNFVENFKRLVGMTPTQYRTYLRKIHKWFRILD